MNFRVLTHCPHCKAELTPTEKGADLKAIREATGLGLRQFAKLASISPGYATFLENDKRPMPLWAPDLYRQTAHAYGQSLIERWRKIGNLTLMTGEEEIE